MIINIIIINSAQCVLKYYFGMGDKFIIMLMKRKNSNCNYVQFEIKNNSFFFVVLGLKRIEQKKKEEKKRKKHLQCVNSKTTQKMIKSFLLSGFY